VLTGKQTFADTPDFRNGLFGLFTPLLSAIGALAGLFVMDFLSQLILSDAESATKAS
jgi:hypothetical protein